jgi:hypothetical protein
MPINPQAIVEGIVGIILSTAAVDTVAVFDSSFNQLFQNARPLQDTVRENSRVMDHPLESGQLISDYKIILPIEIEIPVIINAAFYLGTYQQIKAAYLSSELLTVQTRAASYSSMIISEMPRQEDPEKYDAITVLLKFRQVQLVKPSTTGTTSNPSYAPADPTSAPTQDVGLLGTDPIVGVDGPYGLQPLPYTTSTGSSSVLNYTVPTMTQNGTVMLPVFNTGNQGSLGSVNGLPQGASTYNTPNLASGQSQSGSSVSALNPLQAYGMQGGL